MEALSWCKPEFAKVWRSIHGDEPKILLITGQDKSVTSTKVKITTCHIEDLSLKLIEEYDVITTVEQFFNDEDQYYTAIGTIVNILWKQRNYWTVPWYCMVREAANWIYSRNKVVKNDGCAKAEFIKACREARHHGLSLAVDTLRFVNIDKEIRDLTDYTFIKKLGASGLPDDLHWLYGIFNAFSLMQMKPRVFVLSTASGAVGEGVFSSPIWHKTEHEDILKLTGIEICSADIDEPVTNKSHNLGVREHTQIIKKYLESKNMNKIAKEIDRSFKTVYNLIAEHNQDVRDLHEYRRCHDANVPFSKIDILVSKAGRPKKEKAYQELNAQ